MRLGGHLSPIIVWRYPLMTDRRGAHIAPTVSGVAIVGRLWVRKSDASA